MTLQSSSTSGSDRRLLFALVFAATVLMVVGTASAFVLATKSLGREGLAHETLLAHQLGKIGAGLAPDIIFVGDSSLGNAISASAWSDLSSSRALNLALTGSFGYEGSYNMIRRVIAWQPPRRVVVMQSADMLQRDPSPEAYFLTAPGLLSPLVVFWRFTLGARQVEDAITFAASYVRGRLRGAPPSVAPATGQIVNDYIKQGPRLTSNPNAEIWSERSVRSDKAYYLGLIAKLCTEHGIDCIYAHGPLMEPNCSLSTAYFSQAARIIAAKGIRLAQVGPICFSEREVGDSIDHVHPDFKLAYTRKYYDLIAPQFRR